MNFTDTALEHEPTGRVKRTSGRWWSIVPVVSAAIVFVVVVPALEINDSHLLNPGWPAHARLHEGWQLLTNGSLALTAAWMAIVNKRTHLAAWLAFLIVGPLLAAYALRNLFGGSMSRDGGNDIILSSAGAPVILMLAIGAGLVTALVVGAKAEGRTPDSGGRLRRAPASDKA